VADELRVRERWFSERMQQPVTVMRWGVFGQPVLVFPSAGGDAEEIERNGLVDACGPLLAEGRVKLYSVDSAAGQAMAVHYREKVEAVGPKVIYAFPGSVARRGEGARTARKVKLDLKDPPRLPGSPMIE